MDERDRQALSQMLKYPERAIELLGVRSAAVVVADEKTFFPLSYVVQIIGEAAGRVSAAGRALLPGIPWNQVVGIRHHLVHGYEDIDADILVKTVQRDLPPLIASLRIALEGKAR
jgi:uncharacterized protein with HEPN domain